MRTKKKSHGRKTRRVKRLPLPALEKILEECISATDAKKAAKLEREFLEGYNGRPMLVRDKTTGLIVTDGGPRVTSANVKKALDCAFEAVKKAAVGIEDEMIAEDGGSVLDAEFANAVGCTVPKLLLRERRHEFFSFEAKGGRYWPRWQIGLPGLHEVLTALAAKRHYGWSIALFFTCPTDVLFWDNVLVPRLKVRKNDSPLSLLRRCGVAALPRILRHAERWLEHGAT